MQLLFYTMIYDRPEVPQTREIQCVPLQEKYFDEYCRVYNQCFYGMRELLDLKPYGYYQDIEQLRKQQGNIFVYLKNGSLIGGISCSGNELDDLFVHPDYTNRGIGRLIVLWGMRHVRKKNGEPITIHVYEGHKQGLRMYQQLGFRTVLKKTYHKDTEELL